MRHAFVKPRNSSPQLTCEGTSGQREMLMPIEAKKRKEAVAKKTAARPRRKSA
jgi:hypothetical protein